jgi:methionyl-tRNA formyltransferase
MRIAILTTETLHHSYFVHQVLSVFPDVKVFLQKESFVSQYNTSHELDDLQIAAEAIAWAEINDSKIAELAITEEFKTLNQVSCIESIKQFNPNVTICFGTSRIGKAFLQSLCCPIFNLHGGNPQQYRGLDTNLWCVWHNDFSNLAVSLHELNENLDDGDVFSIKSVKLNANLKLENLRTQVTEICVDVTLNLLQVLNREGYVKCKPQTRVGRYYSAMPSALKTICQRNFLRQVKAMENIDG